MTFDTIYYHANCTDGLTGAALLAGTPERFAQAAILCTHGKTKPEIADFAGKKVAVVDYCFDEQTMQTLASAAEHLVVLDHHKSAKEIVEGIADRYNVTAVFGDNAKCESGAMLAWNYMHPGVDAPYLVQKVAERDTWNFGEDRNACETICAGLYHVMQNGGSQEAAYYVLNDSLWDYLSSKGIVVREVVRSQVGRAMTHAQFSRVIHRNCLILNEKFNVSELGEAALREESAADYAFMWFDDGQGNARISLRSRPGSMTDCAAFAQELASNFGGNGGGHKHAAGCSVELDALMNYWY